MPITQEMFRFVATRRPDRSVPNMLGTRLIRDFRRPRPDSVLVQLFGTGRPYRDRLRLANDFVRSRAFVEPTDPDMLAIEPAIAFLRERLEPGMELQQLMSGFAARARTLTPLVEDKKPPNDQLENIIGFIGRLFDTLYALTIRGFDRYGSTNYAADGLRLYHVLALLWISHRLGHTSWRGLAFDDYDILIDVEAAGRVHDPDRPGKPQPAKDPLQPAEDEPRPGAGEPRSAAAAAALVGTPASFRVPLEVGAIAPPAVGDLILVEQELRGYEEGEIADILSLMRGEQRERTTRNLTRPTRPRRSRPRWRRSPPAA